MESTIPKQALIKLKDLKILTGQLNQKLEDDGMPITDIPKEQLFAYNLKSITSSVESLLRNEPSERPILRLKKDIPDALVNLDKVMQTVPGRKNSIELERIKQIVKFFEQNYELI